MADQDKNEDSPEGKGGGTTLPVYVATKRRPPMKRVYLYRVVDHHTVLGYKLDRPNPVAYDKMKGEIDDILREIAANEHGPGTPGLGSLTWRRRNYFVVVYEDPKTSMIRGNAVDFAHDTFDNGQDIPDTGEVRRFFCINHMQKRGGGDLGEEESETFKFTINHHGPRPKDHTATGTNTGPP